MKILKKNYLFSFLLTISVQVYPQFRVQSNGYIATQITGQEVLSPISIGCSGDTANFVTYRGNKNGLKFITYNGRDQSTWSRGAEFYNKPIDENANFYVGVLGRSIPYDFVTVDYGRTYGVMGIAANMTSGYNYGVFGRLQGENDGTGIYGTIGSLDNGVCINGQYAGYFNGPTKVVGEFETDGITRARVLTTYTSLTSSDSSQKATIQSLSKESLSDRLANVDVFAYYEMPFDQNDYKSVKRDTTEVERQLTSTEKQALGKQHYGLNIEKFEKQFPELVYEMKDGSKVVNYLEVIPLLVKCINELNEKLESTEKPTTRKSLSATSGIEEQRGIVPTLKQNTPNPFTERTTIRFSLPTDSKNAFVYIFDMTGKLQKQIPVDASMQSITIDGYELQAGMYIYSLIVNDQEIDTKRMILSK